MPGMQPKQQPQQQAGFDRAGFNDFVAGKPTMVSLFKRDEETSAPKNLQTPSFIQQVQPQAGYTDVDLWNKLKGNAARVQTEEQANNSRYAELDKKYGIDSLGQNQSNPVSEKPPVQTANVERSVRLDSNIKVDNADIPPFLRRKFDR